jgi:integrase
MAKKAKELTALAIARLKEPGRYAVGGVDGLHLRIVGQSRAWVLRIKVGDRRCDIGLGPYPEVGLSDAREAAREHRKKVREGIDPRQERKQARAALRIERAKSKTFKDCAEAYIEAHKAGWKNAKHAKQWGATLEAYAYPIFGSLPVASIDTGLVRDALTPIWATKTETASRLRGRIECVLDWAKVNGYRDGENPARWRGHLDKLLPARSKVQKVEHHAALPYAEVGAFVADLRERDGTASRALELGILTAARSGEVRGATWAEVDLVGKVWTIPGDRMKAGKEHRVPLSDAAVALLEATPCVKGSDYLFPAPRGGPLSDMALSAVLKRMERGDLTVHGFRSTFRDWAGETTAYPREVIEHALAHQLRDKAEAAYQRGDLLAKRTRLMADWAKFCAKVAKSDENVVAMKQSA